MEEKREKRRKKEERKKGKQKMEMVEKRNFWLTYFKCQGGAGTLIHVVTIYILAHMQMCVYSTLSVLVSVCVSVCAWYNCEKEFKSAPLPVRLIYIYIPEG